MTVEVSLVRSSLVLAFHFFFFIKPQSEAERPFRAHLSHPVGFFAQKERRKGWLAGLCGLVVVMEEAFFFCSFFQRGTGGPDVYGLPWVPHPDQLPRGGVLLPRVTFSLQRTSQQHSA